VFSTIVGIILATFVVAGARPVAADARPLAAEPELWVARKRNKRVSVNSSYFTLLVGGGGGRPCEESLDPLENLGRRVRVVNLLAQFAAIAHAVRE
jgi:hypothetical protein